MKIKILFYELVYQFSYKLYKKKHHSILLFLYKFISGSMQIYFELKSLDVTWTYAVIDVNEFLKICCQGDPYDR